MILLPMETIAEQDTANFDRHFRALAYSHQGSVVDSEVVFSDEAVEAAHDRLMALPHAAPSYVVGPFRTRRVS